MKDGMFHYTAPSSLNWIFHLHGNILLIAIVNICIIQEQALNFELHSSRGTAIFQGACKGQFVQEPCHGKNRQLLWTPGIIWKPARKRVHTSNFIVEQNNGRKFLFSNFSWSVNRDRKKEDLAAKFWSWIHPFHIEPQCNDTSVVTKFVHVLPQHLHHVSTATYFKAANPYFLERSFWNSSFNTLRHLQKENQLKKEN